jgi:hypothetical protein
MKQPEFNSTRPTAARRLRELETPRRHTRCPRRISCGACTSGRDRSGRSCDRSDLTEGTYERPVSGDRRGIAGRV